MAIDEWPFLEALCKGVSLLPRVTTSTFAPFLIKIYIEHSGLDRSMACGEAWHCTNLRDLWVAIKGSFVKRRFAGLVDGINICSRINE